MHQTCPDDYELARNERLEVRTIPPDRKPSVGVRGTEPTQLLAKAGGHGEGAGASGPQRAFWTRFGRSHIPPQAGGRGDEAGYWSATGGDVSGVSVGGF